jgi:2-dehydropantoate 2-reductase
MMTPHPKIVIIGAGAVGCYFGGLLIKAGFPVTFIAREHQIQAFNDHGLTIEWSDHQETFPASATTNYSAITDASFVFIAVKTLASSKTAQDIAPYLQSNATVISLQNGLDNARLFKEHISQTCYSAMVYAAIAMIGPNQVKHFGGGSLIIGNTINTQNNDRLTWIANLLDSANIPNIISENISTSLWEKFVINCIFNGLSAIAQINYADLMRSPGILDLARLIKEECLQIAEYEGVTLDQSHLDQIIIDIPVKWPLQMSSMAQDLAKGKPTEIDYLNGAIVAKGQQYGIPTPMNAMLVSIVKMCEFKQNNFKPTS